MEVAMEFSVGDRVLHPVFGEGSVLAVSADAIDVQFDGLETKRTIRKDFPLSAVPKPASVEEVSRELVYAMGLVSALRSYCEDSGRGDIQTLAQVDAISDKLGAIAKML
jgi:hypothetical protein